MRRWLIVFMLLMVQLQFVWGAAAAYCGHEATGSLAQHFGHHEHSHEGDDSRTLTPVEDSNGLGILHADCGSCHFGTSGTLPVPAIVVVELGQSDYLADRGLRFSSHVSAAPERPDRRAHLAAA